MRVLVKVEVRSMVRRVVIEDVKSSKVCKYYVVIPHVYVIR